MDIVAVSGADEVETDMWWYWLQAFVCHTNGKKYVYNFHAELRLTWRSVEFDTFQVKLDTPPS